MTAKRVISAVVVVAFIGAAASGWWFHHCLWSTRSAATVELEIEAGSSARDILARLHAEGLLPSVVSGRLYLRLFASGRMFHYGYYRFAAASRPVDVLEGLLEGSVEMFTVTIVEGTEMSSIAQQFVDLGVGSGEQWLEFGRRVDWIEDVVSNAPSLEGFLFPDTYRFARGIPAEDAARHLVRHFEEIWREETRGLTEPWGSALEVVTLASLVEAETSLEEERPLIAGVFANRLRRGMLLQCDPTVVYALKRRNQWRGRLLRIHWEIDDPYNTYRNPGLPPGPINSPGRAALAAALKPASTPYLYFVARPGGGHVFSKTLSEHNRAAAQLMSSRR